MWSLFLLSQPLALEGALHGAEATPAGIFLYLFTKGNQIDCKLSSPCPKFSQPFLCEAEEEDHVLFRVANTLVSMTAERENESQALTYSGIKSHPLREQITVPGGPWDLESTGFSFIQMLSIRFQEGEDMAGLGAPVKAVHRRRALNDGDNRLTLHKATTL